MRINALTGAVRMSAASTIPMYMSLVLHHIKQSVMFTRYANQCLRMLNLNLSSTLLDATTINVTSSQYIIDLRQSWK